LVDGLHPVLAQTLSRDLIHPGGFDFAVAAADTKDTTISMKGDGGN
jgi:hypothetical protein